MMPFASLLCYLQLGSKMNKPVFLMVRLCVYEERFCEAASDLFLGFDALCVMSPGKLLERHQMIHVSCSTAAMQKRK